MKEYDMSTQVSGTIKALDWKVNGLRHATSLGFNTTYTIMLLPDGSGARWQSRYMGEWFDAADSEAAKSAAQADYEARILAAIQPDHCTTYCDTCGSTGPSSPCAWCAEAWQAFKRKEAQPDHEPQPVVCLDCGDTGMRDTGGVHPWGEHISVPCDCTPSSAGTVSVDAAALESLADEMHETYREMLIGKMPTELEVYAWVSALRALAGDKP